MPSQEEMIWDFIAENVNEYGIFPEWHDIAEALDQKLHIDNFDLIHKVAQSFGDLYNLQDVDVRYNLPQDNSLEKFFQL